jgi:hypothetical protein
LTSVLIEELLFRLWPGSRTTTLPARLPVPVGASGLGVGLAVGLGVGVDRAVGVDAGRRVGVGGCEMAAAVVEGGSAPVAIGVGADGSAGDGGEDGGAEIGRADGDVERETAA